MATSSWVEGSPHFSGGAAGKTSIAAPQPRSWISTTGSRHGFQGGQSVEMRLPKVKRTYGRVLWAMWTTLAVCWMANLWTAQAREVKASFPNAPQGQGQGKGQEWEGQERSQGSTGWESQRCTFDSETSPDHGAQFARLQEAGGARDQERYWGEKREAIFSYKSRNGSYTHAGQLGGSGPDAYGAPEGCCSWKSQVRRMP